MIATTSKEIITSVDGYQGPDASYKILKRISVASDISLKLPAGSLYKNR